MPGRTVVLTFDDAYRDFVTAAWPLLRRYGFMATVFVAADHVGGRAEWDRPYGEPAELASWDELRRLAGAGVELGSHSGSHPFLTRMDLPAAMAEGRRSRERLEQRAVGRPIVAMSYPFGDHNLLVRRAMAACGYAGAVTTAPPGLSRLGDSPMALPRQIVLRDDDLDSFVAKLGAPERATWGSPVCASVTTAGSARICFDLAMGSLNPRHRSAPRGVEAVAMRHAGARSEDCLKRSSRT